MENQKQEAESKRNGIELLENVIKSNERNRASNLEVMKQNLNVQHDIKDIINSNKQMQTNLLEIMKKYDEIFELYNFEQSQRAEFIARIPDRIDVTLSQNTIDFYDNFHKKEKRRETLIWSGVGITVIAVLVLIISANFASRWYRESIKAKSELRESILTEIADEGKKIYDVKEIKILMENKQLIQLWIKNNPKNAEDFLRFKDGYNASRDFSQGFR